MLFKLELWRQQGIFYVLSFYILLPLFSIIFQYSFSGFIFFCDHFFNLSLFLLLHLWLSTCLYCDWRITGRKSFCAFFQYNELWHQSCKAPEHLCSQYPSWQWHKISHQSSNCYTILSYFCLCSFTWLISFNKWNKLTQLDIIAC